MLLISGKRHVSVELSTYLDSFKPCSDTSASLRKFTSAKEVLRLAILTLETLVLRNRGWFDHFLGFTPSSGLSKLGSSTQNFQDLAARFHLLCIKLLCKLVLCLELLCDVTGLVFILWTSVTSINHLVFAQGTGLASSVQFPVGNTNAF